MQRFINRHAWQLLRLSALVLICGANVGCVGMVAHLMHIGFGNKVEPNYAGLDKQRVAVVCVSQSSAFGPTKAAIEIAEQIEKSLKKGILEVEIVSQQDIEAWMDEHDWNQIDFRELGQGVGAQKLIAVDLNSFSLYEGKTLYKGRCDVDLTVYDLTQPGNDPVYEEIPPQIQYPITAGIYTADTSEEAFRRQFVKVIAHRIARNFFEYDVSEEFSQDPTALGF